MTNEAKTIPAVPTEIEAKHQAAIRALTDLIQATVETNEVARFESAKRMCSMAQSLVQERGKQLKDFAINGGIVQAVGPDAHIGAAFQQGFDYVNAPAIALGGGVHNVHNLGQDLVRMIGPFIDRQTAMHEAQLRAHRAAELRDLKQIEDGTPGAAPIRARIRELMKLVDEEGDSSDGEVVPADVLRGHQTREPSERANAPHPARPDARGEYRGAEAPRPGEGVGRPEECVVHRGRGQLARLELDLEGAAPSAVGADSGRPQGAVEGAEAEPQTTVGGEVLGRDDRGGDDSERGPYRSGERDPRARANEDLDELFYEALGGEQASTL